ncbi:uncharacterized protein LOC134470815 [Cavia porcellus]|uniref:uncharacterized protein LOC134470815 n=1 Tax=Cavia porcellus TaxID=10141 RepID=UPI002FE070B3
MVMMMDILPSISTVTLRSESCYTITTVLVTSLEMGNCCTGSCLLDAEIVPSMSRQSIVHSNKCCRRVRLWLPESAYPERDKDGDSTKVLMEVVPCDSAEDEKQFIAMQAEPTANGNFPPNILVHSLPPYRTEEDEPLNALVDTGGIQDGTCRTHALAGHSITVVALVHTDAGFADPEDQTQGAATDSHKDTCEDGDLESNGSEDRELPEGWGRAAPPCPSAP